MCFCSSVLLVRLNSFVLLGNMVISVWQSTEGTGNLSSAHEPAFSLVLGNHFTALSHCFPPLYSGVMVSCCQKASLWQECVLKVQTLLKRFLHPRFPVADSQEKAVTEWCSNRNNSGWCCPREGLRAKKSLGCYTVMVSAPPSHTWHIPG